jgi:putative ABC transport system permease protein
MSILTDVRVAWRAIRSRPASALIAVLTLSLVVGAGSAIIAVINATFIRPLPYADESRLVALYQLPPGSQNARRGTPLFSTSFVRMRERLRTVESVAGIWPRERALTVSGEPETVDTAGVSPDYFKVLGVTLRAGRMFTDEEDASAAHVAVVSGAFAQSAIASGSVGAHIVLDGESYEIIGVLPVTTEQNYLGASIYTPLGIHRGNEPVPTATIVSAVARVRPGVTADTAKAEIAAAMKDIVIELPNGITGWTAGAASLRENLYGDARPVLTVLFLAICLLTAIACANLANVTLAEMSGRRDEITLRTALGARRAALVRLIATEHVLVALAGGAIGLLMAKAALPAILSLDANTTASLGAVTVDWRVQLGALMLALLVSVASGVLPAVSATRGDLALGLAQSSRRTAGSRRQARTRAMLVALETTIATVLLITSALLVSAFNKAASVAPGFDPTSTLAAQLRLPPTTYPTHADCAAFVNRMLEEVRGVPGIVGASAAFMQVQPGGGYISAVTIEGRPTADGQARTVQFRRASPGYFETMKIAKRRGRTFTENDTASSEGVVVISEQFANEFFPGEDPIGHRIIRTADPAHPVTIIGIVADARDRGLEREPAPTFYLPYGQNTNAAAPITLIVRTSGDTGTYRRAITQAVHRVDPSMALSGMTTLEAYLAQSLGAGRFRSVLLLAFAALGLVLAIVGIYGVTSRGVSERTRELGIRLALGSGRGQVWRLVLRQSLGAVVAGIVLGVPLAVLASVYISRSVPGIALADIWTALPSVFVLAVAGGLAAAAPTLRATRIDPVIALRGE